MGGADVYFSPFKCELCLTPPIILFVSFPPYYSIMIHIFRLSKKENCRCFSSETKSKRKATRPVSECFLCVPPFLPTEDTTPAAIHPVENIFSTDPRIQFLLHDQVWASIYVCRGVWVQKGLSSPYMTLSVHSKSSNINTFDCTNDVHGFGVSESHTILHTYTRGCIFKFSSIFFVNSHPA